MKTMSGMLFALLTSVALSAPADPGDENERPGEAVSCRLSADALSERTVAIFELFEKHEEVRELEDGYAFRFPGDEESAASLIDFVRFERQCCSFFALELAFEAHEGPIWLRVRGSQEAKSFVESWLRAAEESRD